MNTVPESSTAPISVVQDGDELRILIGDQVVAAGPDISNLIETARQLGQFDPLTFRAGTSLLLGDLTRREKALVLANVSEDTTLRGNLDERQEEVLNDLYEWSYTEVLAIETGISVDGRQWGWLPLSSEHLESVAPFPDAEHFQLIPAGPREEILYAGAMFVGANMTSGWYTNTWIRGWPDLAAVSWSDMEDQPTLVSLSYEIDDWNALFLDAFRPLFGIDQVPCPGCEDKKDWDISIDAHPMFSDELIGQAMVSIWRPCKEHEGEAEQLTVVNVAGHDWHWTGSYWIPS